MHSGLRERCSRRAGLYGHEGRICSGAVPFVLLGQGSFLNEMLSVQKPDSREETGEWVYTV